MSKQELKEYYDTIVDYVIDKEIQKNSTREEIDKAIKRQDEDLYNHFLEILQDKLREVSIG